MASRHFFKSIPVTFSSEQLGDEEIGKTAILRSRKQGWVDFMKEHDLKFGDFLVFEHKGNLVFNVFIFDPTNCEKEFPPPPPPPPSSPPPQSHHHHHDQVHKRHHHHHDKHHHHRHDHKKSTFTNTASRASSSTTLPSPARFVSTISASNLIPYHPYLNVPTKFARSNGLNKMLGTITIRDKKGRAWQMKLGQRKTQGIYERTFIGTGWYEFAVAHGLKAGDVCILELDRAASRINEGLIILDAHVQ
ncbi:B3 DNA binding domain [Macleaya cordata]|uniref:B3 DNA binding domain n=1 Tax=Macleaya cordata TaxID=56857 RepID=A0A200Q3Y2_MACCD|nr:B3 DNA binding domain [Macleaya cordata]